MKISLLTDGIYPYVMGGMQKHSYFLAKHLAQKGVEIDLYHFVPVSNSNLEAPFSAEELAYINIINLEYPAKKRFPGHYLYERYLYSKAILNQLNQRPLPDFIYAKGFSGWAILKSREFRKKKIPIGVNFHGYEMFQRWPDLKTGLKLQILKAPVKYTMAQADFLFSYGGKISEIISKKGFEDKIIEIPTGIGSEWLRETLGERKDQKIRFVFVGRSERRKGIVELNKVLTSSGFQNFEFHFVGPIPESDRLIKEDIIYHGALSNQQEIKSVLDQMDVLVCPSYSEGMPNVIMEGMARGLVIIATDVGAVNMLVDEANGWVIKGDIITGIKDAIIKAINVDDKSLMKMKWKSINKVKESFTWEEVIKTTISKIQECIS
ncbi:glycosyltransferase family 4 protein [Rhodonellum sp.]|uniref:glycosyltransferase family 4 protein n=1 Tax=Rhodonellum sp. TaxID=2231180 RepID=UPI002721762D|nr:glycosyltransferase family 4 protein [Rhodonellum sp.]MDO9551115.1 glycosyltransferase family 4 protein [Rhodonellum sp.]